MSRRIFFDVEEAISREVRRISFHEDRTADSTVLEELFDPFTGQVVQMPVEADFYDSSADTSHRQYPHFFVRLLKTREDRFSNREVGQQWGNQFVCSSQDSGIPVSSQKAYEQVLSTNLGSITSTGNLFETSTFRIRKIQQDHLLRILEGNNAGTYKITAINVDNGGNHTIEVSNDLLEDLPAFSFDTITRTLTFLESVDLTTIAINDILEDSSSNSFNITSIDLDNVSLVLDGVTTPDNSSGSKIIRSGNVFKNTDPDPILYVILDQSKPVIKNGVQVTAGNKNFNAAIPLDLFYLVRIDSKERATHIEVLNRMWEEFNPPRTALPTIIWSKDSAEQLLTEDITAGGSSSLKVITNENFKINDNVYVFDDITPTKSSTGGFQTPFSAKIVDKIDTNIIVLDKEVPDTFLIENNAKVVSNATYQLLFFHFIDHITKDVEGAQYWVHEFQFWVQVYVDRQGEPLDFSSNINHVSTPVSLIDQIDLLKDI